MSTNDITFFSNPHPSLLSSHIKIGDNVMYTGDGYLSEVIFKVDSYDSRNNGHIIAILKKPYINFCAPIEKFIKVGMPSLVE